MASFKPTKIQVYPKLGEKVTQDTLYWKNYKVNIFYFWCEQQYYTPAFVLLIFYWVFFVFLTGSHPD